MREDRHGARWEIIHHKTSAILREHSRAQRSVHTEVDFGSPGMLFTGLVSGIVPSMKYILCGEYLFRRGPRSRPLQVIECLALAEKKIKHTHGNSVPNDGRKVTRGRSDGAPCCASGNAARGVQEVENKLREGASIFVLRNLGSRVLDCRTSR